MAARVTLSNCKSDYISSLVKSLHWLPISVRVISTVFTVDITRSGPLLLFLLSPPWPSLSSFLAVHTPNSGSLHSLFLVPGVLFFQTAKWLAPSHPSNFCSSVTLQVRPSQHPFFSPAVISLTNTLDIYFSNCFLFSWCLPHTYRM